MRGWVAVLLALGAVAGVTIAVAQERSEAPRSPSAGPSGASKREALPAPHAALPREPARLGAALTATTRHLHEALEHWDPATEVPREVTYLALHHQRILRLMATRRSLGNATLARLPKDVRGEARDTLLARRDLAAIPRSPGRLPRVRVARAALAAELRRHYAEGQRRFGVHWSILASINFVESAFGRVRSASEAGARGPMQFLPATWRAYGMSGDIDKPRDAILAAANYLRKAGAPEHLDRALLAYNHSTAYVRAIRRFARRMRADPRAFLTYYAWQVFARTPTGVRQLTGPGRDTSAPSARSSPYTVMQMNLCLSGLAGCYGKTAYPAVVEEAVARIRELRPDAVTLNETCRSDVARIAQRTSYHLRFTRIIYGGELLSCVRPDGRGLFGDAVLTQAAIVSSESQDFEAQAGLERRRWLCVTTRVDVDVCTAHLNTRSPIEIAGNDAQCAELAALLARRAAARTVAFGGDVNRRDSCAPTGLWTRTDSSAEQAPGLQHVYGSGALRSPSASVVPAEHSDHDLLLVHARLTPKR